MRSETNKIWPKQCMYTFSLVPRPLIQRVYRLQYNARKNGLVDLVHIPYTPPEFWRRQSDRGTNNLNDVN